MADYVHADDGKVHTRYSDLIRCTPAQVSKLVAERLGGAHRYEGSAMKFGTTRHDMWAKESEKTGKIPECFFEADSVDYEVDHIEKEFVVELFPGIVIHMRPDAVASKSQTIIDYKTATKPDGMTLEVFRQKIQRRYELSKQLKFYAWLLGYHKIRIKSGIYLIEIWNKANTEIIGYAIVRQQYTLYDFAKLKPWAEEASALLAAAVEQWKAEKS